MTIESPGTGARQNNQSGLADQLRSKASSALSLQKNRATEGLGSIVDAVRSTGRQLGDGKHSGIAGYVNTAADSLQRWTDTLQHKDVGEIVEDIQRFGRRQPALFIGLSFGAGLLGARFLKSSRPESYTSSYRDTSGTVRGTGYGATDTRADLA